MASIHRTVLLFVALMATSIACSSAVTPAKPTKLTPFDEAVQKLNASGYTRFASLVSAYAKMKEVKAILSKPMTMFVPDNAAIDKVKITQYKTTQLQTLVLLHAGAKVIPFAQLKALPLNTSIPTLATDPKTKKTLFLMKVKGRKASSVVLQGKPGSTMAIKVPDFYKNAKLIVHTTNAVVFPVHL
eukprot:TRINITY_DN297_c0_g2_i2.p1 TRINITY_DN297_c0_g2~~TRINITY_DN297_c0_g2_i2.p1  ORF type:complete len:186 (-),score=30.49 TRINITY_DN297_c0_g2_i2:270-827(-)